MPNFSCLSPFFFVLCLLSPMWPTGLVQAKERPELFLSFDAIEDEVSRILFTPHGRVDGVLLKDQTLVRFSPINPIPGLVVGASIRAEGKGRQRFMAADKITIITTGIVLDLSPASSPPRPLQKIAVSSVVRDLLGEAGGGTKGIVLEDGSQVTLTHGLRERIGDILKIGIAVRVRGEGGTYDTVKVCRADWIEFDSGKTFAESIRPARPRSPKAR